MYEVSTKTARVRDVAWRSKRYRDGEQHGDLCFVRRCGPFWECVLETWIRGRKIAEQHHGYPTEADAEAAVRRMLAARKGHGRQADV